jgi:hypothetical protein
LWFFVAHRQAYLAAPWRAVVGFGGAAAILAGIAQWARRKEKTLRAEEEAFERHLAEVQIV